MFIRKTILKRAPAGEDPSGVSAAAPTTQTTGKNTDAFGYAIPPAAAPAAAAQAPAVDPKAETKIAGYETATPKKEDPAVPGYVDPKATPAVDPKATPAVDPAKPADPAKLDYKIEVKDLAADEIKKIEDFALANKLPKEAATALAEQRKLDIAAFEDFKKTDLQTRVDAAAAQRSGWIDELKNDKEFGGEKYAYNLKKVGSVLEKFFPNTNKMLTEKGGMLPSSVIRDLHGLHKQLFGTDELVVGDSAGDTPKGNKPWNDGSYYK